MRFAYADPPYPGQAKKKYRDHLDYAGEVDHRDLIDRLYDQFDGWALSSSSKSLSMLLGFCGQRRVRTLVWVKPLSQPLRNNGIYGWEPVLLCTPRIPPAALRDYIICSPDQYTFRPKPEGYVTGAKPAPFCHWIFRWLGVTPDEDEFVDLFPGSGAVTTAWESYARQPALFS